MILSLPRDKQKVARVSFESLDITNRIDENHQSIGSINATYEVNISVVVLLIPAISPPLNNKFIHC